MLVFRWRKFVYVMPTSVATFLLALLVVEGFFFFFDKRKKNRGLHNSNDVRATFVGTIVIASLRGGDKYIEKAIEDVVDAEGYYEVIGY